MGSVVDIMTISCSFILSSIHCRCHNKQLHAHLPKSLGAIHSRAMDENGVEEHGISWAHFQVHPGSAGVIVTDTMV